MQTLETKKTQKEILLDIFHAQKSISNFELRAMTPPMFQYPVRIKELIEEGHPIFGHRDPMDKRKYWYTYQRPKTDLFYDAM